MVREENAIPLLSYSDLIESFPDVQEPQKGKQTATPPTGVTLNSSTDDYLQMWSGPAFKSTYRGNPVVVKTFDAEPIEFHPSLKRKAAAEASRTMKRTLYHSMLYEEYCRHATSLKAMEEAIRRVQDRSAKTPDYPRCIGRFAGRSRLQGPRPSCLYNVVVEAKEERKGGFGKRGHAARPFFSTPRLPPLAEEHEVNAAPEDSLHPCATSQNNQRGQARSSTASGSRTAPSQPVAVSDPSFVPQNHGLASIDEQEDPLKGATLLGEQRAERGLKDPTCLLWILFGTGFFLGFPWAIGAIWGFCLLDRKRRTRGTRIAAFANLLALVLVCLTLAIVLPFALMGTRTSTRTTYRYSTISDDPTVHEGTDSRPVPSFPIGPPGSRSNMGGGQRIPPRFPFNMGPLPAGSVLPGRGTGQRTSPNTPTSPSTGTQPPAPGSDGDSTRPDAEARQPVPPSNNQATSPTGAPATSPNNPIPPPSSNAGGSAPPPPPPHSPVERTPGGTPPPSSSPSPNQPSLPPSQRQATPPPPHSALIPTAQPPAGIPSGPTPTEPVPPPPSSNPQPSMPSGGDSPPPATAREPATSSAPPSSNEPPAQHSSPPSRDPKEENLENGRGGPPPSDPSTGGEETDQSREREGGIADAERIAERQAIKRTYLGMNRLSWAFFAVCLVLGILSNITGIGFFFCLNRVTAACAALTRMLGIAAVAAGTCLARLKWCQFASQRGPPRWCTTAASCCAAAWGTFCVWCCAVWHPVGVFFSSIWLRVAAFCTAVWKPVAGFFASVWARIAAFCTTVWKPVGACASGLWKRVASFCTFVCTPVGVFLTSLWARVIACCNATWHPIRKGCTALWTSFSTGCSNCWAAFALCYSLTWTSCAHRCAFVWSPIAARLGAIWNGLVVGLVSLWKGCLAACNFIGKQSCAFFLWLGGIFAGCLAGCLVCFKPTKKKTPPTIKTAAQDSNGGAEKETKDQEKRPSKSTSVASRVRGVVSSVPALLGLRPPHRESQEANVVTPPVDEKAAEKSQEIDLEAQNEERESDQAVGGEMNDLPPPRSLSTFGHRGPPVPPQWETSQSSPQLCPQPRGGTGDASSDEEEQEDLDDFVDLESPLPSPERVRTH
uniref:Uncharacterized protein n=1 Tax=Chromera velia CCMP2878 TaxID=1169474 RepID=A0A0G4FEC7_9ALVE|eukprot:Cvel_16494.t1-p1 / transcript=Cvel_16494.t1 / gene=Cvel_16494 / organism=Chromera_velia_CCMP2878 / gene_product=hypothetical protein / transcript_product=hypothetical protein / location=Cvel_scaffold1272:21324-26310(-) / protein_length=1113 / sequence_SO=supercontig / SO=protein_coding / is_pseudo=false